MKRLILILMLIFSGLAYSLSEKWVFYKEVGGVKVFERIKDRYFYSESCEMNLNDKGYNTQYAVLGRDSLQILDVNLVTRYQNDTLWRLWLGDRIDSAAITERIGRLDCGTEDYYCFELNRDRPVGIFYEKDQSIIRYHTVSHNRGVWEEVLFRDGKLEQINTDTLYYHTFSDMKCMGGRSAVSLGKSFASGTVFLIPYISNFMDSLAMQPHRVKIDSTHADTLFSHFSFDFNQDEDTIQVKADKYKKVSVHEKRRHTDFYYNQVLLGEFYSSRMIYKDTCEEFFFNVRVDGWVVYRYKKLQYKESIEKYKSRKSCPEWVRKISDEGGLTTVDIPHKILSEDSRRFSSRDKLEAEEHLFHRFLEIERLKTKKGIGKNNK